MHSPRYQRRMACLASNEQAVNSRWVSDYTEFSTRIRRSDDPVGAWQSDFHRSSITGSFPVPPKVSDTPLYVSIFSRPYPRTGRVRDHAHLDDVQVIKNATTLSLDSRLAPQFPVAEPVFEFPPEPLAPMQPDLEDGFAAAWDWALRLHADRKEYWHHERETYHTAYMKALDKWKADQKDWDKLFKDDTRVLRNLRTGYARRGDGVANYVKTILESEVLLPPWCPEGVDVQYSAEGKVLLIEAALPDMAALSVYKTRSLKSGSKTVPATKPESRDFRKWAFHFLPIRLLWAAWKADSDKIVQLFCVNGIVDHTDGATGQQRKDVVQSSPCQQTQSSWRLSLLRP